MIMLTESGIFPGCASINIKAYKKRVQMININFYRKIHSVKKAILAGEKFDNTEIYDLFEKHRSEEPIIYNIETTNACNMRCVFCPRTTKMTRSIEHLDMHLYKKIVDQLRPWTDLEWQEWIDFTAKEYNVNATDMNQNHFFLHIIPQVIVLHGFGDPLLDAKLAKRIELLSNKDISSYFSCNPANISVRKNIEMMQAGLGYLKYSIDSIDDETHKNLRGSASNYSKAFAKIIDTIEEKEKKNLKTQVVITMIDLKRPNQMQEWAELKEVFKGHNVYIYLKSQDQTWYDDIQGSKELNAAAGKSVDWSEFCHYPWSSLTVKSNGEVAMCTEDYNNEIILGNVGVESLYDIWNSQAYENFRRTHFNNVSGNKCNMCTDHCDKRIIGDYLNQTAPTQLLSTA